MAFPHCSSQSITCARRPHTRHLQNALDAYKGELAAQQPYEWIEPEREALRRLAVEALTQLASLHEPDKPEQALAALEHARSLDQYGEEIYQRIMELQARLNRPDAVRRTFRLLETALEELDADPSEETRQLLWRLKIPRAKHQSEPDATSSRQWRGRHDT